LTPVMRNTSLSRRKLPRSNALKNSDCSRKYMEQGGVYEGARLTNELWIANGTNGAKGVQGISLSGLISFCGIASFALLIG